MVARCCYGVAMALLGGCYRVAWWLLDVAMVLLGCYYGVARCC